MRRFVLLLGIACRLSGQTEDKPAAEWIRSGEPLKQAWAAHWIVEQRAEPLVPEMLRVLADPLPAPIGGSPAVTDAEAARLAILDALIQLNQPAPLADLVPLIEKFPTEVLILAARSHEDASGVLLQLLDRPHNYAAFIAIGNLLTPRRDAGFVLRALREFDAHDEIMVFNPGQDQNIGSGWAGDTVSKPDEERPAWPETGTYVLMVSPSTASRSNLIADSRYRVSMQRRLGRTFADHGFQEYGSEKGRTIPDRAQEFLADYLDIDAAQLPVHAAETLKLTWAGDADFRDRVGQFFAGQRLGYAALVQALIARKYLSAENAAPLRLRIRPYVNDQRRDDRTKMPDVQALTGNQ